MDYSIVVAASASDPAANQYLAPYAGAAIAEYFLEKGQDVLSNLRRSYKACMGVQTNFP